MRSYTFKQPHFVQWGISTAEEVKSTQMHVYYFTINTSNIALIGRKVLISKTLFILYQEAITCDLQLP
jgi:hypothetical protein